MNCELSDRDLEAVVAGKVVVVRAKADVKVGLDLVAVINKGGRRGP